MADFLSLVDGQNKQRILLNCKPVQAGPGEADLNRIRLDASTGGVRFGGNGVSGKLGLYPDSAWPTNARITFDAASGDVRFGGNGKPGILRFYPGSSNDFDDSNATILMNGRTGNVRTKGNIYVGGVQDGDLVIFPEGVSDANDLTKATLHFDGHGAKLWIGSKNHNGEIGIFPSSVTNNDDPRQASVRIDGESGSVMLGIDKILGGEAINPSIRLIDSTISIVNIGTSPDDVDFPRIDLSTKDGGDIKLRDKNGINTFRLTTEGSMRIGPNVNNINGREGVFAVTNKSGIQTIRMEGDSGDIWLENADCAEEFDISSSELALIEPGTVMIIGNDGNLLTSTKAYDKKVAGVISGGGDFKPGIVLDKKKTHNLRAPLAMLGKVYCKVDADKSSINVGDMLTTSNTPGHAMRATNRSKAFGAIIGKALRTLKSGKSMIPILIALQ